jgi:glutaminyl-tRNA synthetase
LKAGEAFQLERIGYFTIDSKAQESGDLVLNRSVAMRDSWAKKQGK